MLLEEGFNDYLRIFNKGKPELSAVTVSVLREAYFCGAIKVFTSLTGSPNNYAETGLAMHAISTEIKAHVVGSREHDKEAN